MTAERIGMQPRRLSLCSFDSTTMRCRWSVARIRAACSMTCVVSWRGRLVAAVVEQDGFCAVGSGMAGGGDGRRVGEERGTDLVAEHYF